MTVPSRWDQIVGARQHMPGEIPGHVDVMSSPGTGTERVMIISTWRVRFAKKKRRKRMMIRG